MIGNRIYELRKEAHLSQEKLAELVGVSRQTISNWETNQTIPDLLQANELAMVFGLKSTDELLNDEAVLEEESDFEWKTDVVSRLVEKLRGKISAVSIDVWFKDMKYAEYENGVVTFAVTSEYIKDVLSSRYDDVILDALRELGGQFGEVQKIEYTI